MKPYIIVFVLFFCASMFAQTPDEVVTQFFEALNSKNTEALSDLTVKKMQLHSLTFADSVKVTSSTKEDFIKGIKGIPAEVKIEERVFDITSSETEYLAQFQVPYEFYVNEELSHSGTNVITLVKVNGKWLISYIADTRKR